MLIIHLESFPIEQMQSLEALEVQLGAWAADRTASWRMLAYSRPFDMQPLVQVTTSKVRTLQPIAEVVAPVLHAVRQDLAVRGDAFPEAVSVVAGLSSEHRARLLNIVRGLPAFQAVITHPEEASPATWQAFASALAGVVWQIPWLKEMVRFYEALGAKHLRSANYYLLVWNVLDTQAEAVCTSLEQATGRGVRLCDSLPPVITTTYRVDEQRSRLVPTVPGHPYLAVLRSYAMNGLYDAATLHTLMSLDFDVALAVDVVTLPHGSVMRSMELAKRTAATVIEKGVDDPKALTKYNQADEGMRRLNGESLHDVQIAVLVSAQTEKDLAAHIEVVRDRLGSLLRLDSVAGATGELVKLWSTTPASQIDAPFRRHNVWSHGVGCLLGLLGYHRASRTNGLAWGLDMMRRAPLFYDLFADNQAAHAVVLGKTGFGKSFFLNVVTLRAAAQLGYRVIAMDAFKNGARIAAAAGGGAVCHWLGNTTPINVLDVIYDERDGDWVGRQVQHASGQIALVFGRSTQVIVDNQIKETLLPYDFDDAEAGILDRVLHDLYVTINPGGGPREMPLLSDVVMGLERVDEPEARGLARRLRFKLYGSSTSTRLSASGRELNTPSGVDWSFTHDINYFDFSEVPEHRRAFCYSSMVGAFNRYMRDPRRDVQHRTLFLMDEFHYITRVESVARLAADICKVARKYGVGLMPVDQNPSTFLNNAYGRQIYENAVAKFLFHLDDMPAREVAAAMSDLTPEHVRFLTQAQRGRCVAAFENDLHYLLVEASPEELHALRGS